MSAVPLILPACCGWARFSKAARLCSRAGLTPRHRESDVKVTRGHITHQGSPVLRRAPTETEAIQRIPATSPIQAAREAITARRGNQARNTAKIAAARQPLTLTCYQLLTLACYRLRDGQIRCLSKPAGAYQSVQAA